MGWIDYMFLSIIVPAYNAEKYILRNLTSIKIQNFDDLEVVIVNDGSTDNTKNLIVNFIENNSSMKIKLINIENGGLANARNVGLRNSQGDFFINLDADDFLEEGIIQKLKSKYIEDSFDICMYGYQDYNEETGIFEHPYEETMEYIESIQSGKIMALNKIRRKIWICQGSACFRKSIVNNNKIHNHFGLNQGEDFYFITKMLIYANKVSTIPEVGVSISYRKDSMMHSSYNESYLQIFKLLEMLIFEVSLLDDIQFSQEMIDYLSAEYEIHRLAIAKKIIVNYKISQMSKIRMIFKQDIPNKLNFKYQFLSRLKKFESYLFNNIPIIYILIVKIYRGVAICIKNILVN